VYEYETGVDDSATGDETSDQLTVDMDGTSYVVDENVDLDGDGELDAAVVATGDGYVAVADTDADGVADSALIMDQDGTVVAGAEYDATTGQWATTSAGDEEWADDGGPMYTNDATDVTVSQSADGSGGYISTGDGTTVLTDGSGTYVSTDGDSWST
jgi:hypothetical protein